MNTKTITETISGGLSKAGKFGTKIKEIATGEGSKKIIDSLNPSARNAVLLRLWSEQRYILWVMHGKEL